MSEERLPVHGFVLAGGKSSRMGQDKAQMQFCGRPLVEIAVARLQTFCSSVSIVGNRDDLIAYAPVVRETRLNTGPGAGLEAGLSASQQPWSLFTPVDVPLLPAHVLARWAHEVIVAEVDGTSFLIVGKDDQPAFCLIRCDCLPSIRAALERGERRILDLLYAPDNDDIAPINPLNVKRFAPLATASEIEFWFSNVNTLTEFAEIEAWAKAKNWKPPVLG